MQEARVNQSSRSVHGHGGVALHVRQWNPQHPITVVLVHGYPDCSHVWDRVAEQLAQQFHVVSYDVRGAGASEAPADVADYKLDRLRVDFEAVINATSPDAPVHLIAHDWGSIQSWESVTEPALKHRIASFTSISGPCLDHVGQWVRSHLRSLEPARMSKVGGQLLHSWYVGLFQIPGLAPSLWKLGLDQLWPEVLARTEGLHGQSHSPSQRKDGVHGIKLYRANMPQRLAAPRQRHTTVPIQLLVPLQDPYVTTALLEDIPLWADRVWREDIDAGHWLPLSAPEWVAERVQRFVQFIDSGQPDDQAPAALRQGQLRPLPRRH